MRATVSVQVTVEVTDVSALRLAARQAVAGPDGAEVDEDFLAAATDTVGACLTRLLSTPSFEALDTALGDIAGARLVGVWLPDSLVVIDEL